MTENHAKHLELIQAVISRMASNSFMLKGWTVTLAAALLAFGAKDSSPAIATVALFPAFVFWGLDAYYLRKERLFRALYVDTITALVNPDRIPYSMDVEPYEGSDQVQDWWHTLWSPSVVTLHSAVVAVITIVGIILALLR